MHPLASAILFIFAAAQVARAQTQLTLRYVGCFSDTPERDLAKHLGAFRDNTPETCAARCAKRNYSVVGVQWGRACFCSHPPFGRYGEVNHCTTACTGDSSRTCGGGWANDIYIIGEGTFHPPTTAIRTTIKRTTRLTTAKTTTGAAPKLSYRGCYLDAPSDPDLQYEIKGLNQTLSPIICAERCRERGFSILGLQWGDSCWCGHNYGRHGLSRLWPCDERCPGDCSVTCGGPYTNDVYTIS